MNWPGTLLAGFAGTLVLTSLESGAQQLHLTRMSLPYLLGAMFTPSRDRAKVIGFFAHLINGQDAGAPLCRDLQRHGRKRRGARDAHRPDPLGRLLLVLVPLPPSIHPRMASVHQGRRAAPHEPPGRSACTTA